jgi:hypothetical protein
VNRYEIDISGYLATLESESGGSILPTFCFGQGQEDSAIRYPFFLPYSKSVFRLNDLMGDFLEDNLSFWQFLLAD